MNSTRQLAEKVAIVAGGSSGIGRGISLRLAKTNATIIVVGRNIDRANTVVNEVKTLGGNAIAISADVTMSEDAGTMAQTALDKFGRIDILINVAGGGGIARACWFHESTEEWWDWFIASNLKGVRNCCRAVIEHMMQRRSGSIVNIASAITMSGVDKIAAYCAAKGGVIAFTRALGKEVGPYGIRVNCVSPGLIEETGVDKYRTEEIKEMYRKKLWLGRFGKPEDVANTVVFLASDEASFITGQNIAVDGGG